MAHPDVPAEQAYLDRAYDRLEAVRAETQVRLKEAFREKGGTFQSYTERDIRVRNSLNRLEKLQLGREALIFGRIDRPRTHDDGVNRPEREPEQSPERGADHGPGPTAEPTPEYGDASESFHIGRLAVSDAEHEPLVVDWRAPVAEPFYRATGARPMGLRRRRHFLTDGRRVIDLEDELFAPDGVRGSAEVLGLSGPGVLMAALERAHTGRMRDIVATVQAEQDEIIRSPLPGALVVQGGPAPARRQWLCTGPPTSCTPTVSRWRCRGCSWSANPTFLRYIDQVLPSLGETGAELSTASGMYKGARPVASEPVDVARLKGDPRMARFIRRAVHQRERPLRKTAEIPYGRLVLTVTPQASADIVKAAKRRSGPHNARRRLAERLLWEHFAEQLDRRTNDGGTRLRSGGAPAPGSPPAGGNGGPQRGRRVSGDPAGEADGPDPARREPEELRPDEISPSDLGAELRRRPDVAEVLDRIWPRLTAEAFLHDLLGARPLIELAGKGVLSPDEGAACTAPGAKVSRRWPGRRPTSPCWTRRAGCSARCDRALATSNARTATSSWTKCRTSHPWS